MQVCRECEFQSACFEAMGDRKQRITLDKVVFKLVPDGFGLFDADTADDPELPHIERTYLTCYQTIFGKRPPDKIGQHKKEVIAKFREAKCSLRLFMLANMVGHQQQNITVVAKMQEGRHNRFTASLLTTAAAINRLNMYREMCRKNFGTFDLGALDSLTDGGYEENDIEKKMLHSEVTAARVVVAYKMMNGGPAWEHLYSREELTLDPYWLATEPTYTEHVLKPHAAGEKSTKTVNNHRHAVIQVIAQMKRKRDWAIAIFQARERVMGRALKTVLHWQGFDPIDFEFDKPTVNSTMEFWVFLARAIQHVQCLRHLEGEDTPLAS